MTDYAITIICLTAITIVSIFSITFWYTMKEQSYQ